MKAAQEAEGDARAVLSATAAAAQTGAKASENFVSKFGRAHSYQEQAIGAPDAGAALADFGADDMEIGMGQGGGGKQMVRTKNSSSSRLVFWPKPVPIKIKIQASNRCLNFLFCYAAAAAISIISR